MKNTSILLISIFLMLLSACSKIDNMRPRYIIGNGINRIVLYADRNICSATRLMSNPIHVKCILENGSVVEYDTNYFELLSGE